MPTDFGFGEGVGPHWGFVVALFRPDTRVNVVGAGLEIQLEAAFPDGDITIVPGPKALRVVYERARVGEVPLDIDDIHGTRAAALGLVLARSAPNAPFTFGLNFEVRGALPPANARGKIPITVFMRNGSALDLNSIQLRPKGPGSTPGTTRLRLTFKRLSPPPGVSGVSVSPDAIILPSATAPEPIRIRLTRGGFFETPATTEVPAEAVAMANAAVPGLGDHMDLTYRHIKISGSHLSCWTRVGWFAVLDTALRSRDAALCLIGAIARLAEGRALPPPGTVNYDTIVAFNAAFVPMVGPVLGVLEALLNFPHLRMRILDSWDVDAIMTDFFRHFQGYIKGEDEDGFLDMHPGRIALPRDNGRMATFEQDICARGVFGDVMMMLDFAKFVYGICPEVDARFGAMSMFDGVGHGRLTWVRASTSSSEPPVPGPDGRFGHVNQVILEGTGEHFNLFLSVDSPLCCP